MDIRQTGQFIAQLRKERGLTQQELAAELKVTDKAVSRWETGRGLPDADSLLALSRFFGVTINELLTGRRNPEPEKAKEEEARVAADYLKACGRQKKYRIGFAAVCVLAVLWAAAAIFFSAGFFRNIKGAPHCIIAEDYSYLTLFGEKYVLFDPGEAWCVSGKVLVPEAQVENAPFWSKLLFGETVQLVEGCDTMDFLYLNHEYDGTSSPYYCLERSVSKYQALLAEPAEKTVAEIINGEGTGYDVLLDEKIVTALASLTEAERSPAVNCTTDRSKGEIAVDVNVRGASGPFRRSKGELLYKNGRYYWFDFADIPAEQDNSDWSRIAAYELPDSLTAELDSLFAKMFR